jgi:hypothetical protein
MTQPVSAFSSSVSSTFALNSSAGQAFQLGFQWRVSKLMWGMFNRLEILAPNVVCRRVGCGQVAGSNHQSLPATRPLTFPAPARQTTVTAKGEFALLFIRVHGSNVPLFPTINILYLPVPSPISGFGRTWESTVATGASDMMAV